MDVLIDASSYSILSITITRRDESRMWSVQITAWEMPPSSMIKIHWSRQS
jgi:hypothetical protein